MNKLPGTFKQSGSKMIHKCELKSQINGLKFTENVEGIDEWPHKWPDGEISYRVNNNSMDFDVGYQKRAVTVAFRVWQLRINKLKFRRERSPDVSVDINISFESSSVFKSKHVLAHAFFPGQGVVSGDVEINDEDWDWVSGTHVSTMGKPPLTTVMIHEIGHSLGLRHDTMDLSSMMYPSVDLGKPKVKLSARDVQRIQERYGTRRISQRLLDYFLLRRIRGWDFR